MTALLAAWAWLRTNLSVIPAALIAIALAYPFGLSIGAGRERRDEAARIAKMEAAAEHLQRAADQLASTRAAASTAAISTNRKVVDDALAPISDQAPSDRQRARACIELRRQADAAGEPQPAC